MNERRSARLGGHSTTSSHVVADIERHLSDPEFKELFGEETAKTNVAIALAQARGDAGLTQAALAQLVGARQSYIAKLEGGNANPTIGTIGRILSKLDRMLVVSTAPLVPGSSEPVLPWAAEGEAPVYTATGSLFGAWFGAPLSVRELSVREFGTGRHPMPISSASSPEPILVWTENLAEVTA